MDSTTIPGMQKGVNIDPSLMNPSITNRGWKAFLSWDKIAAGLLILLGAVLRLRQYLTGRSLWADEAMLALNIVDRGFGGLFRPLDYDQGAPLGFLLAVKIVNTILGRHEFALRLFPFLVGLLSLWLFYLLLKRITSGAGLLAALALFAFNPRLIYYSSEVKQYILDVAVIIALLLAASPLFSASRQKKVYAWLAVAGLAALWFSHPALFVLAGIGLSLAILALMRRDYPALRAVTGIGVLWALEVGFLYLLILRDLSQNAYMREYWRGAFFPMPPWSEPGWLAKAFDENIGLQFGIPYGVFVVVLLMLAGWAILWFRQRGYAMAFAGILLVTLTASALGLYPVFERMILFFLPIGFALVGKAVEAIYRRWEKYRVVAPLAVLLLTGYLLYGPLATSVANFIEPKYFEHIRPSMDTLRAAWRGGDALYVSNGALPAFRFYASFYGLEDVPYTYGEREDYNDSQLLISRLDSLEGQRRVWVLLSHVYERDGFNEREFILNYLNENGEKRREFRLPGTSVFLYLYDLQ
jgi:hypothetical protein